MDQSFRGLVDEDWLRAVLEEALAVALPEDETYQVSLTVTGDEAVRSLNWDYRGLDEVTDVLSFSSSHSGHWEGETEPLEVNNLGSVDSSKDTFVYPASEAAPLGEVVIAYPQAQRQALERGVPADQELALLIVHGVLHLVGHDHLEPQEQAEMQEKERTALDAMPQVAATSDRMPEI